MRSGTCFHCSDNGWNCPYPHCRMSSNRHWNVVRHLERRHDGVGVPLNQNDFAPKMYKEFANQEPSLSPTAVASSIAAVLYHQPISKKRIMIPLIMFCQRFVKLRSLKICFPNFPLARRVFPYLQALMVLRMLLVIASLPHLEIPPTPNLFASMMTNSKLSAIADMHVKVV